MRLTLVRDRLTWITYGQLAIFAYFLYGFGPAVPLLRDEQHTSRAVASLHGTAIALGTVIAGALLPRLVRRFGRSQLMWGGQVGMAAGVLGLSTAHAVAATLTWVTLTALAGSFVVNGVVAVLSDHHGAAGSAAISEANALAAGVGAISPLIIGGSVAAGFGWRPGLAALVLAVAALALVASLLKARTVAPSPAVPSPAVPPPSAGPPPVAAAARVERRPLPRRYWLAWVSLLATGSIEVCLNLWVGDVLRSHAGVSAGTATAALSAIVGGMCLGRLVGVRLLLRIAAPRVLLSALAVSAVGFTVFWLATAPWLALAGLALLGLGNSLHYPLAVGLAVRHSAGQPDLAAAKTGYAMGISFGLAPFGLGLLSDRIGPHPAFATVYLMIAVAAVAVLLLTLAGDGDAVRDGKQDRVDPLVEPDRVVELHNRPLVRGARTENAAAA